MRKKVSRRVGLNRRTSFTTPTQQEGEERRPDTPVATAAQPATQVSPAEPAPIAEEGQSDGSSGSVATTIVLATDCAEVVAVANEPPTEEQHIVTSDNACGGEDITYIRRKKKSPAVLLKDDEEQEIANHIRDECHYIYDKGHREYKNAEKTAAAFDHMAKEFVNPAIKGAELRTWFHSNRSRLGRITLQRIEEPEKRLTQREEWIRNIFGFLEPHIVRQRKSKSVAFKNVSTITQLHKNIHVNQYEM